MRTLYSAVTPSPVSRSFGIGIGRYRQPEKKEISSPADVQWWAENSPANVRDAGCPIREYFRRDSGNQQRSMRIV